MRAAPGDSAWEAARALIDISYLNYLVFLGASMTALRAHIWIDPDETR
jgi:hypothetical protein